MHRLPSRLFSARALNAVSSTITAPKSRGASQALLRGAGLSAAQLALPQTASSHGLWLRLPLPLLVW